MDVKRIGAMRAKSQSLLENANLCDDLKPSTMRQRCSALFEAVGCGGLMVVVESVVNAST